MTARLHIGTATGVGVWLFTAIALAQAPDGGLPRALGVALVLRARSWLCLANWSDPFSVPLTRVPRGCRCPLLQPNRNAGPGLKRIDRHFSSRARCMDRLRRKPQRYDDTSIIEQDHRVSER